ncbi:MAG: NADP-dependent isocitrate dehydrogenase [Bacteroidales bacterium]|nr:NADP-dependent isocitrate dehydrogenase [Bacteroidales bacterium]
MDKPEKIALDAQGKLKVPLVPIVPFIEGDGVGAEITPVTLEIVDQAVSKAYGNSRHIAWTEVLAGEKAYRFTGSPLPDETLDSLRDHLVGMKGPLNTPVGGGFRSLNVTLRQTLDLYVCLRPVRWFKGVVSPVKEPQKVNMTIFRENTEDIYAGIEWKQGTPEAEKFLHFLTEEMGVNKIRFPETSSFGVKPVSEEGSRRLIRAAIRYAIERNLPSVTIVHKGNIMKYTEGMFRQWGYELAREEFSDRTFLMTEYDQIKKSEGPEKAQEALKKAIQERKVVIKDVIADAFLQNTLLKPEEYSVIATLNLNGDYISDQLAAMVGGIGIAPGANINSQTGHAIFEATHGTAPDIAGKNQVNPSSMILSAVMMLEYLGWDQAAALITTAMEDCFLSGNATQDLARFMPNGKSLSTLAFKDEMLKRIETI